MSAELPVPARVLFVDDEPDVLAGIRTALRKERSRFDFVFHSDPRAALEDLQATPAQVLVSDARMPGLSGPEFLREVAGLRPDTVRVVLSGEAGTDLMLEAMHSSHRWLAKPCPRDVLLETITGAVRYQALMQSPELREAIGGAASLPSPPALYRRLSGLAASHTTTSAHLAEVVASDPAVAAKILQLANSAFGGGANVSDIDVAITRIGRDNLMQVVLSLEVLQHPDGTAQIPGLSAEANAELSMVAAEHASRLASPREAVPAATAALLHQAGLLLEAAQLPERLAAAYDHALDTGVALVRAERDLHQVAHPDLGAHLLTLWGLPSELVFAVANSHLPVASSEEPMSLVDAVRTAVVTAHGTISDPAVGAPHRFDVAPDRVLRLAVSP